MHESIKVLRKEIDKNQEIIRIEKGKNKKKTDETMKTQIKLCIDVFEFRNEELRQAIQLIEQALK